MVRRRGSRGKQKVGGGGEEQAGGPTDKEVRRVC